MMNGYGYDHGLYEDDDDEYLGGLIHNILDFPVESLDVDGLTEDWASKLGPIPSEVFREMMPPVGIGNMDGGGGGGGSRGVSADFLKECGGCVSFFYRVFDVLGWLVELLKEYVV